MGVKVKQPKTAQDLFKGERQAWLDSARATARKLLIMRPYITINDVLAECPRPTYVHRNTTGHVFRHSDFRVFGVTRSRAKLANRRLICQWKLNEDAMSLTMRQIRRARREAE